MARETFTDTSTDAEFQKDVKVAGDYVQFGENGAYLTFKYVEEEVTLSGASTAGSTDIPAGSTIFRVDTQVTSTITTATGYQVGDGSDADKWGDITGTATTVSSDGEDYVAGDPTHYTAATNITFTAKTSNFGGGKVRYVAWYMDTRGPQS